MNYLPFTILAYVLNAVAVTIDKLLLTSKIQNPLVYVFYVSAISLITVFLIPFTHPSSLSGIALAALSSLIWTLGLYLMFKGLQVGNLARVVPVIGALVPLFLLAQSTFSGTITVNQSWAVGILVTALFFLTLPSWRGKFTLKESLFEVSSAFFYALSYILLREAYLRQDFLTVLVYSKLALVPGLFLVLLIPDWRRIVLSGAGPKINLFSKTGTLFLAGQTAGGIQGLLLSFSVSLANPALVNSLQGSQYLFLLLFSFLLSKKYPQIFSERLTRLELGAKIVGIALIGLGLYVLASTPGDPKPKLGLTFSPRYASSLNLDPQQTYLRMLSDLHPKLIRLPVYWDEVEKQPGDYDFSGLDFYLEQARRYQAGVVLVLGMKQPRWPECYLPGWTRAESAEQINGRMLDLVRNEVLHFKKYSNIIAWQVENEPFLRFGVCPDQATRARILPEEAGVARSLDPRPVIITDSGELSDWTRAYASSDILGTTLYRRVWSPVFGSAYYPLPPFFYQLKGQVASTMTGKDHPIIISELQTEPWPPESRLLRDISIAEQAGLFRPGDIGRNLNFAKETGFSEVYLWGVEWWYFMDQNGYPGYLEQAKLLFR